MLNDQEAELDEKMKRNVQIMKRALRSSKLEKKIHQEVLLLLLWDVNY